MTGAEPPKGERKLQRIQKKMLGVLRVDTPLQATGETQPSLRLDDINKAKQVKS